MAVKDIDVIFEITVEGKKLDALTINQLTELIGNTKQSVYSLINQKNKNGENYFDICRAPAGALQISVVPELCRYHLGKRVEFNDMYLQMAVDIENSFSRNLITKAFVEVSKSVHKKNTFKLITLAYMLRKSEIERWSSK